MANGTPELIKEVKSLLEEDRSISTKSALRLALGMQIELYTALKDQDTRIAVNTEQLKMLERKNIMLWVEAHPKLVVAFITLIVILTTIVDVRVVLAKFFGVEL